MKATDIHTGFYLDRHSRVLEVLRVWRSDGRAAWRLFRPNDPARTVHGPTSTIAARVERRIVAFELGAPA